MSFDQPPTPVSPGPAPSLAKRLANWGTNLLVTGVIVIAGLALGREVTSWWHADATTSAIHESVADVVGNGSVDPELQLLEVGEFPHLVTRREIVGDERLVLAELRESCRRALAEPRDLTGDVGPAELRMLRGLDSLQPTERVSGRGNIYQLERPLPMAAAVRESAEQVADGSRRVVSWGLAFPAGSPSPDSKATWTLFTFALGQEAAAETDAWMMLPSAPLAQRTLSLRTIDGGTLVGFRGAGEPRDWIDFYDRWFQRQGWQADAPWRGPSGTWQRRYTLAGVATADLLVSVRGPGRLQALAVVNPLGSSLSNKEKNP